MSGRFARRASLCLSLAMSTPAAAGAQVSALPSTPGVEVARGACVSCHGADLITGQRLTRAGWDREVAKMERWSRTVPAPDRDRLLDYLAGQFGVPPSPPAATAAPSERGREVHDRACLTCHDGGFTRAQRLTAAGWRRTVAKMVQWGAPVPPDGVDALVAFLLTAPPAQ